MPPRHFNDFITFLGNHGWTLQKLETAPVEYFEMRRAYLKANRLNENESAVRQGIRLMTQCSTYLFPKLDVTEIIDTLIKQGQFENTAAPRLLKPLWDLQEYLHLCPDGGATNLENLLKPGLEESRISMEEARNSFLKSYEGFENYMKRMESEVPQIRASLKRKLASVFFASAEAMSEDKFLQTYRTFLKKKFQESTVNSYLVAINEIKTDRKKDGLDEIFFSKLGNDFQKFIDLIGLYGSRWDPRNSTGTALSYMGYFLFPESEAMKIFDDLMKNEFEDLKKDTTLLATMWDLELFLRHERSINGIEALRDGGVEKGREHIAEFTLKYQHTLERIFRIGVLEDGLIRCIFREHQREKVQQDIEDLEKFIARRSTQSSASSAIAAYGKLFKELQKNLGPSGWPDGFGKFLDFRKETLLDRNGTINSMGERATPGGASYFNLLTIAAQQRYPVLQRFIASVVANPPSHVTILTSVVLNFLTHLREKRREKNADIDEFPEDVNEKSIDEFLQNPNYKIQKIVEEETLKLVLSNFAKLPSIDKIKPGVDFDILDKDKAEYQGEKVEQDIKDLKEFIISNSRDKDNPENALLSYKNLFNQLQEKIGKAGWPDSFDEFLDLREKILLERNKTINPTKDADNRVTSFFNLVSVAAQQRYPALRQVIISELNPKQNSKVTIYTHFVLNFLTQLRVKRREKNADIDKFLEDVTKESIYEFFKNKNNNVPPSMSKDKFELLMLKFAESFSTESQTEFSAVPA